jgi:hypothetical protein
MSQSKIAQISLFVAQGTVQLFADSFTVSEKPPSCWLWHGRISKDQHPMMQINEHSIHAARIAWVIHHQQPLPGYTQLARSCDSVFCVSPKHHQLGKQDSSLPSAITLTPHPTIRQAQELLLSRSAAPPQISRKAPDKLKPPPDKPEIYHRGETEGELRHLALTSMRRLGRIAEELAKAERERAESLSEVIRSVLLVERSQQQLSSRLYQLEHLVCKGLNDSVSSLSVLTSSEIAKLRETAVLCRQETSKVPLIDLGDKLEPITQSIQHLQETVDKLITEIQEIKQLPQPIQEGPQGTQERALTERDQPSKDQPAERPPEEPKPLPIAPICKLFSQIVGDDIIVQPHEEKDIAAAMVITGWSPERLESKMTAFAQLAVGQSRADRSPASFLQMLIQQRI